MVIAVLVTRLGGDGLSASEMNACLLLGAAMLNSLALARPSGPEQPSDVCFAVVVVVVGYYHSFIHSGFFHTVTVVGHPY